MSEDLPAGWQSRSLSSLGEYSNGYAFSKRHWAEHGLPIVRIAQITGTQGVEDRYPGLLPSGFRITDGDLIFSWSGTLSVVKWQGGPAWLNQHLFKVTPSEDVDRRLLFHVLRASVAEMEKRTHGSTMKHIKRSELEEFSAALPLCGQEQAQIAEILDTLDTAIHGTEALIAKLKAVKQGLLHDLLTRGIDANGEVRPPQSEAPDLYKSSLLGWIPCDWEAGPLQLWLSDKPKNGYSPKEAEEWTGCQMLGLGCLTGVGFEPNQLKNAPFADARLDSVMLSDGDLLMSRANTRQLVGLVGVYSDVGTPCGYPDLMMRLKPTVETSAQYLQFVLRSPMLRRQIQAHAVGTSESMVKISGRIVRDLVVAMPDRQEQARILDALSAASTNLDSESKAVSALRDLKFGVMDDLLTGRVRVTPLLDAATA
ncbi:restriction endonuclease subunit S [Pseudoxanthomonas composti]|uniref:Restriction endonuclease subunit S n=1 Tax=Pseudoxanthomonas composti TaxID=2137479 RepID=A0A4V1N118_9GAMM|nr:restriction endonuclease subunit S [Pseudoxanthomonas composti]RXR05315.1 restriction endonuclease subunit S [Pseudoxanthomonas composti]